MKSTMPQQEFERLAALLGEGQIQELGRAASRLAERYPDDGRSWQFLGLSYLVRGLAQQALPALTRASELMPGSAAVWDNLGLTCHRLHDFSGADACFRRSTSIQSDQASVWINWSANSYAAGDAEAAQQQAERALERDPRLPGGWLNLGNALVEMNRLDDAQRAYLNALALQPGYGEAELSYGMLLDARGQPAEALDYFKSALTHLPGDWRAFANLGKVFSSLGEWQRAIDCYRRALGSNAAAHEVYSGLLFLRMYEDGAECGAVFEEHRRYGLRFEEPWRATWPKHVNVRDPDRRIKLGFVSGDFREHPVAYFFEPFFEALDRSEFEVYLYFNHRAEDQVSERLRRSADRWLRVVQMNDEQLKAKIMDDRIDILIDLAGHSSYNRLPVFARKPAPIQVSWLGYPGTTGLTAIDYRPIYATGDPNRELARQFTEQLVYLPCAPSFRFVPEAPDVSALPAQSRGYVTFGSLNRSDKLGDAVIRVWSQILLALPDARLLIGGLDSDLAEQGLIRRFAGHGVLSERLELHRRVSLSAFLDLLRSIDILLDPFPFSGLTTSEHAVWMGVPVLTLAGESLVSRQGLVVMGSLDLAEWVSWDAGEYVNKAVAFASDLGRLAELRSGMRSRVVQSTRSGLSESLCMQLAFRAMWRNWCEGREPASFEVTSS